MKRHFLSKGVGVLVDSHKIDSFEKSDISIFERYGEIAIAGFI